MGRHSWRDKAKYLQNTAGTVFGQIGFDLADMADSVWETDFPTRVWDRVRAKICAHLIVSGSFGHEALGRIVGAGHPDYTGDDTWLTTGDILPVIEVGRNDSALLRLAAATLVAAKINYMRGKRP